MERSRVLNPQKSIGNNHVDDLWIINQLFGIITLEQRLSRKLSECNGEVDESVFRQVQELKAWAARFDEVLDSAPAPLPPSRSCRVPLAA